MNKEYIKTANLVLGYLELRFINQHKDAEIAEKERRIWAEQLESKIEPERITQPNIVKACDLWADINGKGFAPTVDQFINCLKKVSYTPAVALPVSETDYLSLWNEADDKGKFKFFIDYPFDRVPPIVRKLFCDYNAQYRGWTGNESDKMMRYHAKPFANAGVGAVTNNQREILAYFVKRKAA
jgi:hypothetical protein